MTVGKLLHQIMSDTPDELGEWAETLEIIAGDYAHFFGVETLEREAAAQGNIFYNMVMDASERELEAMGVPC